MKRHGRRKMIGEGGFWEVEVSESREKIGGGRRRGDTKRRCRGKGERLGTFPLPWVGGSGDGGDSAGKNGFVARAAAAGRARAL